MRNELFIKLLNHDAVREVPLVYIIKIFSAIQEIQEKEKVEEEQMDIS